MRWTQRSWLVTGASLGVLACGCAAGGGDGSDTSTSSTTAAGTTTGAGGATTTTGSGGAGASGAGGGTGATGGAGGAGASGGAGGSGASGGAGGGTAGHGGAGGGSESPGPLAYENIINNSIVDDLRRLRWHTSGAFALSLGTGGKLVRYDESTGAVSLVTTLGKRIDDLDVAADGSFFLVAGTGNDDVGRLWRVAVDGSLQLTTTEETTLSLGEPRAMARYSSGVWAVGAYHTDSISYLYLWQDGAGVTVTKGFNASAGFTDLMWGDPSLLASDIVITGHGANGADSQTYVLSSDLVVSNGWPVSHGNAGGAGWRPGGSYGYFTGTSSNKLYVYDGGWSLHTLPGVGTAASPQAVGWNAAGTRALIVGRAIGPGLNATVIEHRPGSATAFSAADLINQSIPNFDQTPWFGNSSTYLHAVDWRPGTDCSEGLIAGSDNGTSLNPTFGLLLRFYDVNDPDCS